MLRTHSIVCQKGNHDAMLLSEIASSPSAEAVYHLAHARNRMSRESKEEITAWPRHREIAIDDHNVLLVHGSPLDPLGGYVYPDTDLAPRTLLPFDLVVCGHTHRPFVRQHAGVLLANVGSVGLPRDIGNMASVGIYDSVLHSFDILRVPFSVTSVLERWGEDIHEATKSCLLRTASQFVGRVVTV